MKLAALALAAAVLATGAQQAARGTVAGTVKLTVSKSTPLATSP